MSLFATNHCHDGIQILPDTSLGPIIPGEKSGKQPRTMLLDDEVGKEAGHGDNSSSNVDQILPYYLTQFGSNPPVQLPSSTPPNSSQKAGGGGAVKGLWSWLPRFW